MSQPNITLMQTLVSAGLLALVLGLVAHRMRVTVLAGFVLAGVLLAPGTSGMSAHPAHARILGDVGMILLMLGIGLHFPWARLQPLSGAVVAVVSTRVSGALVFGWLVGLACGWTLPASLVFGLCLAPASSIVVLRLFGDRTSSMTGRFTTNVAMSECLVSLVALIALSAIVGFRGVDDEAAASTVVNVVLTVGRFAIFAVILVFVTRVGIPRLRRLVGGVVTTDVSQLGVIALGLGLASAGAILLSVPLAVGALLAGAVLSGDASIRPTAKAVLPLTEAYAVPFFVALGMQFNAGAIAAAPLVFGATLLFVLLGKSVLLYVSATRNGVRSGSAIIAARSLGQIGEFSWVLVLAGAGSGLLDAEAQALILNTAVVSIVVATLGVRTWTPARQHAHGAAAATRSRGVVGPVPAPERQRREIR